MVFVEICKDKLPPLEVKSGHLKDGAELIFQGHVRDEENGQKILALEYEHYEGMAKKKLKELAEQAVKQFAIAELICRHRVGYIPVGESSLQIIIWSEHRKEALAAMDWFITKLKQDVPIWKWGVGKDGSRFPSAGQGT